MPLLGVITVLIAGPPGSKKRLRKMEISKIIFLLIFGGVLTMISAPILWSDADKHRLDACEMILGQGMFGLGVSVAGILIWLLK